MKHKNFILPLLAILFTQALALTPQELLKKAQESNLRPLPTDKETQQLQNQRIQDLKTGHKSLMTPTQIELGKKLYFDPRLSKDNLTSCNTCHNLATGGTDGNPTAQARIYQPHLKERNTPTTYNSIFNDIEDWAGRTHLLTASKEEQDLIIKKLTTNPQYLNEFKKAYGNSVEITPALIADTIAMFETLLITPTRYDDFLLGNIKALSKQEQEGLELFIDRGCVSCHSGINLGGGERELDATQGYSFSKIAKNGKVKIPTLRNITETMPYFHDGRFDSLNDAIKAMSPKDAPLSQEEVQKIRVFFETLAGAKPQIIYPILPPNPSEESKIPQAKTTKTKGKK